MEKGPHLKRFAADSSLSLGCFAAVGAGSAAAFHAGAAADVDDVAKGACEFVAKDGVALAGVLMLSAMLPMQWCECVCFWWSGCDKSKSVGLRAHRLCKDRGSHA